MVSVIMPNLNGVPWIGDQLEALSRQDCDRKWEVIVADNGSTDGSLDLVHLFDDRLPGLRIVHAERRGAAPARNVGAAAADGDLLLFIDSDDVVADGWLRAMVSASQSHDLVGGVIEQEELNQGSRFPRPATQNDRLPRILGRFSYVPAGNCGVRAGVFRSLGGWNEQFAGGMEDQEFSVRASLAGFSLGLAPNAVLHYRHREDWRSFAKQQFLYAREGVRLYRQFKHVGLRRNRIRTVLVDWAWLLWHIPDAFREGTPRADWLRKGATRVGRLVGSLKYRTLYL